PVVPGQRPAGAARSRFRTRRASDRDSTARSCRRWGVYLNHLIASDARATPRLGAGLAGTSLALDASALDDPRRSAEDNVACKLSRLWAGRACGYNGFLGGG